MGLEGFASRNGILYLEEGSQTAYACEVEKVTKIAVEAFTPKIMSSSIVFASRLYEIPFFGGRNLDPTSATFRDDPPEGILYGRAPPLCMCYMYLEPKWNPLVLIGNFGLVFGGGLTFKNKGHEGAPWF